MPTLTEPNNLGDLLKYEEQQFFSRDQVTVADGQTLALGAVIGIQTADGKAYELDPVAADGTEVAVGVLIQTAAPSGSDEESIAIVRHAILSDKAMVWPTGITVPQQAAAVAELKANGVLIREGA